jgi:PAS domain S-box-containing protein
MAGAFAINPEVSPYAFLIEVFLATLVGFGVMWLLVPTLLAPLEHTLDLLENSNTSTLPDLNTLSQDASGTLLRRTTEILKRLRSSEQRYTALFQAIPDGISCFNRQGEYTEVKLPNYFSYVQPNLVGKTPEDLYDPERAAIIRDRRQRMWETGETQTYELERTVDGHISYREVSIFMLSQDEGAALVRDISKRKQAQQYLEESEARFRSFFEHSPNPCLMLESDGVEVVGRVRVNQAFEDFLGSVPDNITTMKTADFLAYVESISHPEDWRQDFIYLSEVSAGTRDGYHLEKRYLHADGAWRWGDYSCSAICDEHGNIMRIFATIQDITARKHAEQNAATALEQLHVSEAKFRAFFENSSMPCFLVSVQPDEANAGNQNMHLLVNQAFCEFLGEDADNLGKMTLADTANYNQRITHPDDFKSEEDLIVELFAGNQSHYRLEKRYLRSDGQVLWGDLTNHALRDEQGNIYQFIALIQDITERKHAQIKLQDTLVQLETSEAKFRAFFEGSGSAHSIITMKDPDMPRADRLLVNRSYDRLMADTIAADMPVHTLADIATLNDALTHPEDLVVENEQNQALVSGQRDSYHLEKRFLKRDGEFIWVVVTHSLIRQPDGNPDLLMSTIQDISHLKHIQAELSQTLSKLEQALDAKNMLMREIHHRVKNNLQVIASLLHLQASVLHDPGAKDALQESRKRVMAMAEIHELMHQTDTTHQEVSNQIDFAHYLQELVALMQRSYQIDEIDIVLELAPVTLSLDQAIPLALITNELISNALKYAFAEVAPAQPTITISLQQDQNNDTINLRVIDNGIGLNNSKQTKTSSLGMTIIESLSDQLGGTLSFEAALPTETEHNETLEATSKTTSSETTSEDASASTEQTDTTGLCVSIYFPPEISIAKY